MTAAWLSSVGHDDRVLCDSPLEEQGFEPSVPPVRKTGLFETAPFEATGSSYRKSQGPLPAVILRKPRA
jgi:hypothetical protein